MLPVEVTIYAAVSTCRNCVLGNLYVNQLILLAVVTSPNTETVTTTMEFKTNSSTFYNYAAKGNSIISSNATAIYLGLVIIGVVVILAAILLHRGSNTGH